MGIDQEGFEVFPDVLTSEDLSRAILGLEGISSRSRAGARHLMRRPAVRALAHDSRLLALAAHAVGSSVLPFRATLFDKSPASNWLVVWHQDTALPLRSRRELPGWGPWSVTSGVLSAHAPAAALEKVVALRVQLDDSRADNGPLRVLPGTHVHGVLTDAAIHELAYRVPSAECLCRGGSIVAMRPLLVHASSKVTAALRRRVLHIEYASTPRFESGLELALA
jgi:ectoine hydroxylase-related dioxygenase (phytanoyl-CoA dioxygenase family)